jgi:hypothetical protein
LLRFGSISENEVQNTMFLDLDGRPIQLRMEDLPDREFAEGLINFHSTMYECRRRLIDKYIGEFDYNAALYFERLNELPIPPMLFFSEVSPSDAVRGVHEQEFIQRKQSTYPIAAHPGSDPQNPMVFAGLTAFLGSEPAIPFAIADLQLAYAYFYNAGFQGKTSFYTPLVDHMYEKLMREISRDEQWRAADRSLQSRDLNTTEAEAPVANRRRICYAFARGSSNVHSCGKGYPRR